MPLTFAPMKRPPLPYLLLLPLLAVLLFGNCGGGVRGVLSNLGQSGRTRFREIVARRRALRQTARKQLKGAAKQESLRRLEQQTDARLDSLLPSAAGQRKLLRRRGKLERQLASWPEPAPRPAPVR